MRTSEVYVFTLYSFIYFFKYLYYFIQTWQVGALGALHARFALASCRPQALHGRVSPGRQEPVAPAHRRTRPYRAVHVELGVLLTFYCGNMYISS